MTLVSIENPASGAVVDLAVGDTLEVRVRQIGGTGYQWSVAAIPAALEKSGQRRSAVGGTTPGPLPGAATDILFDFTATAAGDGTIRFELGRAWETAPIEFIDLDVRVG